MPCLVFIIELQYMARHTWRSSNKFGVTDFFFFRAGSKRWPTYLQYRSHAHTTGLLSTALLLQHSMIDVLTAVARTPVGASTVDVTVPQQSVSYTHLTLPTTPYV